MARNTQCVQLDAPVWVAQSRSFGPRFYFHAQDAREAQAKLDRWNWYSGFQKSDEESWHTVAPAPKDASAKMIHDEWVS